MWIPQEGTRFFREYRWLVGRIWLRCDASGLFMKETFRWAWRCLFLHGTWRCLFLVCPYIFLMFAPKIGMNRRVIVLWGSGCNSSRFSGPCTHRYLKGIPKKDISMLFIFSVLGVLADRHPWENSAICVRCREASMDKSLFKAPLEPHPSGSLSID